MNTFSSSLGLEARLRALQGSFSQAEERVIRLIAEDPQRVAKLSVTALAKQAATSSATVVRASRTLGFDGYPALRLALAAENSRAAAHSTPPLVADISDQDSPQQVLKKLLAFEVEGATATAELIDEGSLEQAVAALSRARRIDVYGVGASALVAQDLCQKLRRIGIVCQTYGSGDESLVSACLLGSQDVALAISHSGETLEALEPLQQAKNAGAYTLAITANARSALARKADCLLLTSGRELGFRAAAMASRTSQLLIIDCLFIGVTQRLPAAREALQRTHEVVANQRKR
ncbi:MurR/RpiR family transcriptional regulator [Pseudomonas reactans]|nr:MurR/RpiR family transcriptional regulator [Pseudomonas reactans]